MSRHELLRQPPRGTRRSGLRGSLRLGALFALLVGVNVYVFFFRDNTSINELLKTGSMQKKKRANKGKGKTLATGSGAAAEEKRAQLPAVTEHAVASDEQLLKGSLKGHNGLAAALAAHKLETKDVSALIASLEGKLDFRSLRPSHRFEIVREATPPHRVRRFVFHVSSLKKVVARRRRDGRMVARVAEKKLKVVRARVGARVESSLDRAIASTGESTRLIYRLLRIFAWDINWSTDVRKGDSFRLIVEKRFLEGKHHSYGRLLAAEYRGRKTGVVRAFSFKRRDGSVGHYTAHGRSVKRPLVKTPINYRRISSRFNHRRFHPVLHKVKAHLGVDYAAPTGTPIFAAGDGTVIWARRSGPAGKMVQIRHDGGVVSVYMHMSRFARGMKRGKDVKQWQTIGYVGATGRATGPHLHFGLRVNGRYIDPMGYTVPLGKMLPRHERSRFLRQIRPLKRQLSGVALSSEKPAVAGGKGGGKSSSKHKDDGSGPEDDEDLWS